MPGPRPPRVPEGLRDLMKGLTKEVLREKPRNIYEFSAYYFESMLQEKKDFEFQGYEPAASYEIIFKNGSTEVNNQVPLALVYAIVPEQLTELIKGFIKAVLRANPNNICEFAVEYFRKLQEQQTHTNSVEYKSYENYLNGTKNTAYTSYVRCACGRLLGEGVKKTSYVTENKSVKKTKVFGEENKHVIVKPLRNKTNFENATKSSIIATRKPIIGRRTLVKKRSTDISKEQVAAYEKEHYVKAIVIIQRFFRRVIKKHETRQAQIQSLPKSMSLQGEEEMQSGKIGDVKKASFTSGSKDTDAFGILHQLSQHENSANDEAITKSEISKNCDTATKLHDISKATVTTSDNTKILPETINQSEHKSEIENIAKSAINAVLTTAGFLTSERNSSIDKLETKHQDEFSGQNNIITTNEKHTEETLDENKKSHEGSENNLGSRGSTISPEESQPQLLLESFETEQDELNTKEQLNEKNHKRKSIDAKQLIEDNMKEESAIIESKFSKGESSMQKLELEKQSELSSKYAMADVNQEIVKAPESSQDSTTIDEHLKESMTGSKNSDKAEGIEVEQKHAQATILDSHIEVGLAQINEKYRENEQGDKSKKYENEADLLSQSTNVEENFNEPVETEQPKTRNIHDESYKVFIDEDHGKSEEYEVESNTSKYTFKETGNLENVTEDDHGIMNISGSSASIPKNDDKNQRVSEIVKNLNLDSGEETKPHEKRYVNTFETTPSDDMYISNAEMLSSTEVEPIHKNPNVEKCSHNESISANNPTSDKSSAENYLHDNKGSEIDLNEPMNENFEPKNVFNNDVFSEESMEKHLNNIIISKPLVDNNNSESSSLRDNHLTKHENFEENTSVNEFILSADAMKHHNNSKDSTLTTQLLQENSDIIKDEDEKDNRNNPLGKLVSHNSTEFDKVSHKENENSFQDSLTSFEAIKNQTHSEPTQKLEETTNILKGENKEEKIHIQLAKLSSVAHESDKISNNSEQRLIFKSEDKTLDSKSLEKFAANDDHDSVDEVMEPKNSLINSNTTDALSAISSNVSSITMKKEESNVEEANKTKISIKDDENEVRHSDQDGPLIKSHDLEKEISNFERRGTTDGPDNDTLKDVLMDVQQSNEEKNTKSDVEQKSFFNNLNISSEQNEVSIKEVDEEPNISKLVGTQDNGITNPKQGKQIIEFIPNNAGTPDILPAISPIDSSIMTQQKEPNFEGTNESKISIEEDENESSQYRSDVTPANDLEKEIGDVERKGSIYGPEEDISKDVLMDIPQSNDIKKTESNIEEKSLFKNLNMSSECDEVPVKEDLDKKPTSRKLLGSEDHVIRNSKQSDQSEDLNANDALLTQEEEPKNIELINIASHLVKTDYSEELASNPSNIPPNTNRDVIHKDQSSSSVSQGEEINPKPLSTTIVTSQNPILKKSALDEMEKSHKYMLTENEILENDSSIHESEVIKSELGEEPIRTNEKQAVETIDSEGANIYEDSIAPEQEEYKSTNKEDDSPIRTKEKSLEIKIPDKTAFIGNENGNEIVSQETSPYSSGNSVESEQSPEKNEVNNVKARETEDILQPFSEGDNLSNKLDSISLADDMRTEAQDDSKGETINDYKYMEHENICKSSETEKVGERSSFAVEESNDGNSANLYENLNLQRSTLTNDLSPIPEENIQQNEKMASLTKNIKHENGKSTETKSLERNIDTNKEDIGASTNSEQNEQLNGNNISLKNNIKQDGISNISLENKQESSMNDVLESGEEVVTIKIQNKQVESPGKNLRISEDETNNLNSENHNQALDDKTYEISHPKDSTCLNKDKMEHVSLSESAKNANATNQNTTKKNVGAKERTSCEETEESINSATVDTPCDTANVIQENTLKDKSITERSMPIDNQSHSVKENVSSERNQHSIKANTTNEPNYTPFIMDEDIETNDIVEDKTITKRSAPIANQVNGVESKDENLLSTDKTHLSDDVIIVTNENMADADADAQQNLLSAKDKAASSDLNTANDSKYIDTSISESTSEDELDVKTDIPEKNENSIQRFKTESKESNHKLNGEVLTKETDECKETYAEKENVTEVTTNDEYLHFISNEDIAKDKTKNNLEHKPGVTTDLPEQSETTRIETDNETNLTLSGKPSANKLDESMETYKKQENVTEITTEDDHFNEPHVSSTGTKEECDENGHTNLLKGVKVKSINDNIIETEQGVDLEDHKNIEDKINISDTGEKDIIESSDNQNESKMSLLNTTENSPKMDEKKFSEAKVENENLPKGIHTTSEDHIVASGNEESSPNETNSLSATSVNDSKEETRKLSETATDSLTPDGITVVKTNEYNSKTQDNTIDPEKSMTANHKEDQRGINLPAHKEQASFKEDSNANNVPVNINTSDNRKLTPQPKIGTQNSRKNSNYTNSSQKVETNLHDNVRDSKEKTSVEVKEHFIGRPLDARIAELHLKSFRNTSTVPWYVHTSSDEENNKTKAEFPNVEKEQMSSDETEFSDSLNENNFEKDSLELTTSKETDMDEDSLDTLTPDEENTSQKSKIINENERTATYLYGIHVPRQTPPQARKTYKKPTAFVISLKDDNQTIDSLTAQNSNDEDGERNSIDGKTDINESETPLKTHHKSLRDSRDEIEPQLEMESPTRIFAELSKIDRDDSASNKTTISNALDATYTKNGLENVLADILLPESENIFQDDEDPAQGEIESHKILESALDPIIELNEDIQNESMVPYDAESENDLSSSWTASKENDEYVLSDEIMNYKENFEDIPKSYRKPSIFDQTYTKNVGGVYEFDDGSNFKVKSEDGYNTSNESANSDFCEEETIQDELGENQQKLNICHEASIIQNNNVDDKTVESTSPEYNKTENIVGTLQIQGACGAHGGDDSFEYDETTNLTNNSAARKNNSSENQLLEMGAVSEHESIIDAAVVKLLKEPQLQPVVNDNNIDNTRLQPQEQKPELQSHNADYKTIDSEIPEYGETENIHELLKIQGAVSAHGGDTSKKFYSDETAIPTNNHESSKNDFSEDDSLEMKDFLENESRTKNDSFEDKMLENKDSENKTELQPQSTVKDYELEKALTKLTMDYEETTNDSEIIKNDSSDDKLHQTKKISENKNTITHATVISPEEESESQLQPTVSDSDIYNARIQPMEQEIELHNNISDNKIADSACLKFEKTENIDEAGKIQRLISAHEGGDSEAMEYDEKTNVSNIYEKIDNDSYKDENKDFSENKSAINHITVKSEKEETELQPQSTVINYDLDNAALSLTKQEEELHNIVHNKITDSSHERDDSFSMDYEEMTNNSETIKNDSSENKLHEIKDFNQAECSPNKRSTEAVQLKTQQQLAQQEVEELLKTAPTAPDFDLLSDDEIITSIPELSTPKDTEKDVDTMTRAARLLQKAYREYRSRKVIQESKHNDIGENDPNRVICGLAEQLTLDQSSNENQYLMKNTMKNSAATVIQNAYRRYLEHKTEKIVAKTSKTSSADSSQVTQIYVGDDINGNKKCLSLESDEPNSDLPNDSTFSSNDFDSLPKSPTLTGTNSDDTAKVNWFVGTEPIETTSLSNNVTELEMPDATYTVKNQNDLNTSEKLNSDDLNKSSKIPTISPSRSLTQSELINPPNNSFKNGVIPNNISAQQKDDDNSASFVQESTNSSDDVIGNVKESDKNAEAMITSGRKREAEENFNKKDEISMVETERQSPYDISHSVETIQITSDFLNTEKLHYNYNQKHILTKNHSLRNKENEAIINNVNSMLSQTFPEAEVFNSESSYPYEQLEEECLKKSASLTCLTGNPESLENTVRNSSSEEEDGTTLNRMTDKLAQADRIVEQMQKRASESSIDTKMRERRELSFEEPVIHSMEALESSSRLSTGDEKLVVHQLEREDTRDSSGQSDAIVFGSILNGSQDKDLHEFSGTKAAMKRHNTIASSDPKALHKTVTIDETVRYIESDESAEEAVSGSSFYLDDDISANIRKKIMAYSLSEADSDTGDMDMAEKCRKPNIDFNISTALVDTTGTSTETESTIVSATVKKRSNSDIAGSGNHTIDESLEKLIEEEAAKKIQFAYRTYNRQKQMQRAETAARRMTLQRGDALRNDSTPDEEKSGSSSENGQQAPVQVTAVTLHKKAAATGGISELAKKIVDNKLKWLALRQNSMPVQIDCEVFRVIPKHMRKRIKSAEADKKPRRRVLKD